MRMFRILLVLLCFLLTQNGQAGVSGQNDRDIAQAVAQRIVEGYSRFDNRAVVEQSKKGKIYYLNPRTKGNPIFKFYEITNWEDIRKIEAIARGALDDMPEVRSISLRFYEKQNMPKGVRLPEKLLYSVDLKKSR